MFHVKHFVTNNNYCMFRNSLKNCIKNMIIYENSKLFDSNVIITNKYYNYCEKQRQKIREKYKNDKKLHEQYYHYVFLQNQFMLKNYKNKNCVFLIFNDNIVVVTFNDKNVVVHDFFMMYDAICMLDEINYKTQNEFFEKYIKNENVEKIIKKCIANYNEM